MGLPSFLMRDHHPMNLDLDKRTGTRTYPYLDGYLREYLPELKPRYTELSFSVRRGIFEKLADKLGVHIEMYDYEKGQPTGDIVSPLNHRFEEDSVVNRTAESLVFDRAGRFHLGSPDLRLLLLPQPRKETEV